MQFNATVLGLHNYYKVAIYVYTDFDRIAFDVRKSLLCRTKRYRSKAGLRSQAFQKFYGDFHGKIFYVAKLAMFPINGIKTKPPMCFSQDICNYTEVGRAKIHALQNAVNPHALQQLMENPIRGASAELNDNRISMFVAQHGKCAISKEPLTLGNIVVHHITPKRAGGEDNYENLILVTPDVHQLIHATEEETVRKYLNRLKSCKLNMTRLNKLRELAGNCKIVNR
jgi:5-methylcytosine-specific restriction endonuclease McrA